MCVRNSAHWPQIEYKGPKLSSTVSNQAADPTAITWASSKTQALPMAVNQIFIKLKSIISYPSSGDKVPLALLNVWRANVTVYLYF